MAVACMFTFGLALEERLMEVCLPSGVCLTFLTQPRRIRKSKGRGHWTCQQCFRAPLQVQQGTGVLCGGSSHPCNLFCVHLMFSVYLWNFGFSVINWFSKIHQNPLSSPRKIWVKIFQTFHCQAGMTHASYSFRLQVFGGLVGRLVFQ
jgi:hypothetical protein